MLIHVWTIKYLQFYQCGSISSKQMNDVPEVNLTLCDNVSSASFTIFETSIFQYVVFYLSTYFLTFIHVYLVLQLVVNQNRWLFHMCSVLQKKNKIPIFSSMDNTSHLCSNLMKSSYMFRESGLQATCSGGALLTHKTSSEVRSKVGFVPVSACAANWQLHQIIPALSTARP